MEDPCVYRPQLPSYVFFECPANDFGDFFSDKGAWIWFLWILAQAWITAHIWMPKSRRLASTEQMFGTPYYSGLFLEQSLALNRRADDGKLRFR